MNARPNQAVANFLISGACSFLKSARMTIAPSVGSQVTIDRIFVLSTSVLAVGLFLAYSQRPDVFQVNRTTRRRLGLNQVGERNHIELLAFISHDISLSPGIFKLDSRGGRLHIQTNPI